MARLARDEASYAHSMVDHMYPRWSYFPRHLPPPAWVEQFVEVVNDQQLAIDSSKVDGLSSDAVLTHLRPGLESLGYEVERGKRVADRIRRPVLFGEQGVPRVTYEIDAVHDGLGVLVEVEAGRAWMGNAVYRDLIRTSLIVGASYLALGVRHEYRYKSQGKLQVNHSYDETLGMLDAVYASGRLHLPFEGLLLFGY